MARESAGDILSRLVDGGYASSVHPLVTALNEGDARLKRSLDELEREAARLAQADERLTPDNPVFRALLGDLNGVLGDNARAIDRHGHAIQSAAGGVADDVARQLPLPYIDAKHLGEATRILAGWNRVSAEAIAQVVNFVESDGWKAELAGYREGVADTITRYALRGFLTGKNPLSVGGELARMIEELPRAYANTLTRTLFLASYRRATSASFAANRDIGEYAVRVATLDHRTCLACILMNGTTLQLGESIADHWNGRCTAVLKIRGIPLNVERGEVWFLRQTPDEQAAIMGGAAYRAWRAGEVRLEQFVHRYEDSTFGAMLNVASLKSLLAERAGAFYAR